ncbi:hypothetical protein EVAR_12824_1 [Eumeta japonica]|uniref:Uncharacterized protein n=1 Tax=Eumeta variegata TaxID=151549 RepID=A0A4C1UC69_EUMVA|nr:hypothetical protein EVAR_12824_1 [Eumeta japonica]
MFKGRSVPRSRRRCALTMGNVFISVGRSEAERVAGCTYAAASNTPSSHYRTTLRQAASATIDHPARHNQSPPECQ